MSYHVLILPVLFFTWELRERRPTYAIFSTFLDHDSRLPGEQIIKTTLLRYWSDSTGLSTDPVFSRFWTHEEPEFLPSNLLTNVIPPTGLISGLGYSQATYFPYPYLTDLSHFSTFRLTACRASPNFQIWCFSQTALSLPTEVLSTKRAKSSHLKNSQPKLQRRPYLTKPLADLQTSVLLFSHSAYLPTCLALTYNSTNVHSPRATHTLWHILSLIMPSLQKSDTLFLRAGPGWWGGNWKIQSDLSKTSNLL